ncbi:hypothetical protein FDP41_010649 [Naegleria fowleri]|uniref:Uncharacterized protein n=1 Tax=Naegleria fowleri TaxID=5763 RepID=A0A6A5CAM3_NAEFO|nr:uncharacterized protein FDP41_010649 [Naegleria fowleri]KAF0983584.1 hypothetical protein FDP41_010649 [Naegleria fowleri]
MNANTNSSTGGGALKFLSSEAMVVASPSAFFSSFHRQETNHCWKSIHSELYKLYSLVASCLGPCGQFKLIVDPNQNQLITKNGNQLLEFMKINTPIMKYLVSLFQNACTEYMDGTISCIILSYELLDLIMNEYSSKFQHVHHLCSDLYSFGEYFLNHTSMINHNNNNNANNHNNSNNNNTNNNNDNNNTHDISRVHEELCIPIYSNKKNQTELLKIIFKSLISNQLNNNPILSNLVLNWIHLATNNFTQFETLSQYNLRIIKQIGKLEESRLLSNTIILENLMNINITFQSKPNLSMINKFCIMSFACWEEHMNNMSTQFSHEMTKFASKLDCHILLLVVKSNNTRKGSPLDLSHYPHLRKFIQILNQRNILVFQYEMEDAPPTSSSFIQTRLDGGINTSSLSILYHFMDLSDINGIITNLQEEEFNDNYSYGSCINNVKMNFKRGGQCCDLIIEFNSRSKEEKEESSSSVRNSYSTLILKSLNHDILEQLEYQMNKCIHHLISIIKNHSKTPIDSKDTLLFQCVIGGGCFETQFSKLLENYRHDNSDRNVLLSQHFHHPSETLQLFSCALLSIPKQLLRNMIPSQQLISFSQQQIHMLLKDLSSTGTLCGMECNKTTATFKYIQTPATAGGDDVACLIKEIPKKKLDELFQDSSLSRDEEFSQLPLEAWNVKKQILLSAINIVVNILRLDGMILD